MTAPAGMVALDAVQPNYNGFRLDTASKMLAAADYLSDRGYDAHLFISHRNGPSAPKVPELIINKIGGNVNQTAQINDWIVIDKPTNAGVNTVAHVVTAAEVAAGERFVLRPT